MITVDVAYAMAGVVFVAIAVFSALDRANPKRWHNTAFWGLFGASFLAGRWLGDLINGLLVIAMVLVGGIGGLGISRPATTTPAQREASAARFGSRLFLPVLLIPATALTGTLLLKGLKVGGVFLVQPTQVTVICTALGVLLALAWAIGMLKPPLAAVPQEARRLMDSVGWAAILPQLLAALGAVFALAGVGDAVARLIGQCCRWTAGWPWWPPTAWVWRCSP